MRTDYEVKMTLTIKNADMLTKHGRNTYAKWLRKTADDLVKNGKLYAKTFRARYIK